MEHPVVKVILAEGAQLPEYATPGAAGVDLRCLAEVALAPGERKLVGTGLYVEIPEGFEGQVRPRSGLALRHGLSMVNTPGTIDSDFRGEVGILLINHGEQHVRLAAGERIAQMVICPVVQATFVAAEAITATDRGSGGFGSTGLK